jgi:hypothetical protein
MMGAEERAIQDVDDDDIEEEQQEREEIDPDSTTGADSAVEETPRLLPQGDAESFRDRWETIQAEFVDEPRRSVQSADRLVADVMEKLASSFSEARAELESQWDRGDDVSTEDLRITLRRYRAFFERLLAA